MDVKLGDLLTVFLSVKGDVYTMGDNINGQLGIGDKKEPSVTPARVVLEAPMSNITCGANHVFCFTKDCKTAFAWGSNVQQQISVAAPTTKKFSSPLKITHLVSSLTTRLICKSRGTVAISKLPINPPKTDLIGSQNTQGNADNLKRLEMMLYAEKTEKENFKKSNVLMASETNQLKQEVMQLKAALANVERTQKKIWGINATTQTSGEIEDGENAFDSKHLL